MHRKQLERQIGEHFVGAWNHTARGFASGISFWLLALAWCGLTAGEKVMAFESWLREDRQVIEQTAHFGIDNRVR